VSARMKSGLKRRGKFYHYKFWDREQGKNVWISTRQTNWEAAHQWVQANVLRPQQERLMEKALGLKPIKRTTFKEFVDNEYWPYAEEHNKESTIRANRFKLRWLMRFFEEIGLEPLTEISEDVIEDYKAWRKRLEKKSSGRGKPKGATINRELKLLSKICKHAVKRGYLREDPTKRVEYYKEPQTKFSVISRKDFMERFLEHCNPRNLFATTEFFDFSFRTGARFSEVTGLKWEQDVDFGTGQIVFQDTKNDEVKYFPMTEYLREMLERLHETRISEYVFPNRKGDRRKDVRGAFKNTLIRAGLRCMRVHDLRHSFVSACASMGMSWEQTAELTGHKSYAMYRRYKHMFQSEQKELLEGWDHS